MSEREKARSATAPEKQKANKDYPPARSLGTHTFVIELHGDQRGAGFNSSSGACYNMGCSILLLTTIKSSRKDIGSRYGLPTVLSCPALPCLFGWVQRDFGSWLYTREGSYGLAGFRSSLKDISTSGKSPAKSRARVISQYKG
jgi:hypothetical protein